MPRKKLEDKTEVIIEPAAIKKLNKENSEIKKAKVATVTYEEIKLLDKGFDELINTDPKYSLQVDPLNVYNLSSEQKEFIKYYCQWKNIKTVCKILNINEEKGIEYYKSYASQQEIRRINLAMYSRQFSSKMLNLDQIGSYLTSLITDNNVAVADRLDPKDKLTATKMLIDLNSLKKEAYENPNVIDVVEIDNELEKLSIKSIKQLIASSKDPTAVNKSKEDIINDINNSNELTLEEKAYLRSLPINELLALQEKINKGE